MRKKYERGISNLDQIMNISNLYSEDVNLYYRVLRRAKKENKCISEFLGELGYHYDTKRTRNLKYTDRQIIRILLLKYPTREISKLSSDMKLYKLVTNRANSAGLKLEEWLKERDFVFKRARKGFASTNESIMEQLISIYPDKIVENLSSKNPKLYQQIKRRNSDIKSFVEELGFIYISKRRS